jgi:hypothetical protein
MYRDSCQVLGPLRARNYSLNIILETDAMVLVAIEKLTIAFRYPSSAHCSLANSGNALVSSGATKCA